MKVYLVQWVVSVKNEENVFKFCDADNFFLYLVNSEEEIFKDMSGVNILFPLIAIFLMSILAYYFFPRVHMVEYTREYFQLDRKRAPGGAVTIGILPNTPKDLVHSMRDLNIVGMQTEADSQYDVVDVSKLNRSK